MILHIIGRVILMLVSFKYLKICKFYFYYEMLYMLLETLIPPSVLSPYYNRAFILQKSYENFSYFYFELWPSLFCSLATTMMSPLIRKLVYDEGIKEDYTLPQTLIQMMYQSIVLISIQIIYSWLGFIFLDSEILRGSNEQLLNNLDDSCVILEENSYTVLFVNDAAKKISKKSYDQSLHESFGALGKNLTAFDSTKQIFAHMKPSIFQDKNFDSNMMLKKIK